MGIKIWRSRGAEKTAVNAYYKLTRDDNVIAYLSTVVANSEEQALFAKIAAATELKSEACRDVPAGAPIMVLPHTPAEMLSNAALKKVVWEALKLFLSGRG